MVPDKPARIDKRFQERLSRQSYAAKPAIEGVRLIDLKRHLEDGGDFLELGRLSPEAEHASVEGFRVRQVNFSTLQPGTIKAWHLHRNQEDLWFVSPRSRLLVGLVDCRDESATNGHQMRFVLGDGHARLLFIPRGVAHGVANPWRRPASMIYFVNQQFSPDNPDEHRLPWDFLGKQFWEIQPG